MALVTGKAGQVIAFTGGSNVAYCKLQHPNRNGVQIEADGFNLEDATVTVIFPNGAEQEPVSELTGTGNKISRVGLGLAMDGIKLGGLPSGTYNVTFTQL